MQSLLTDWKTTISGIASILSAFADAAVYAAKGQLTPHVEADFTAIVTGLGLIFAKDGMAHHGKAAAK